MEKISDRSIDTSTLITSTISKYKFKGFYGELKGLSFVIISSGNVGAELERETGFSILVEGEIRMETVQSPDAQSG